MPFDHTIHGSRRLLRATTLMATLTAAFAWASDASAGDTQRRGLQIEGMVGGVACIPGRARCHQDSLTISGRTRPSFGTGAALGFRPVKWFMFGAIYRFGMLNPDYRVDPGSSYRWAGQHTVALMLRPIIPIWRFDFGLNIAPGYGRQVFYVDHGKDRDITQGFSLLLGPTIDAYVTRHFFVGAEVDFIFNAQKKVCQRRDGASTCNSNPAPRVAPVHQVLFGLHLGATFG